MHKVYRSGKLSCPFVGKSPFGWKEAVFCVTECTREKYFSATFSEGSPLGWQQVDAAVGCSRWPRKCSP